MGFIENVNYLAKNIDSVAEKVKKISEDLAFITNDLENIDIVADNIDSVNITAKSIDDIHTYAKTYLGAFDKPPTTRNDGTPLLEGDLYYDLSDKTLKVWNGSIWNLGVTDVPNLVLTTNNLADLKDVDKANDNLKVYETSLALTDLLNSILNKIEALRNRVRLEIGTILTYPIEVNNKFLLKLDGQKVLKSKYPELWNLVKDYAIEDTDNLLYASYFKDVDENYFRLPDYSGDLTVRYFDKITKKYSIKYLSIKYYIIAKNY